MEIWSLYLSLHTLDNVFSTYNALDTFVENVTVGWAREIGRAMRDSIWIRKEEDKQLYVAPNPIPNALILFLIDVARVN